jgi:hypothetical protein
MLMTWARHAATMFVVCTHDGWHDGAVPDFADRVPTAVQQRFGGAGQEGRTLFYPDNLVPWSQVWDGNSINVYKYCKGAMTLANAHLSEQNFAFAIEETLKTLRPEYVLEISIWNGASSDYSQGALPHYRVSPLRQEGEIQFDMWLMRPRVVREYRDPTAAREEPDRYLRSVINSVDRVHDNPVLRRFWRSSTLVPNRAQKHIYSRCDLPDLP